MAFISHTALSRVLGRAPGTALGLVALSLAACGGGGGGDALVGGGDGDGTVVDGGPLIGTPVGRDASQFGTDELRRRAADDAARGLGVNLGKLARFVDDGTADAGPAPIAGTMNSTFIENVGAASETFSKRLLGVDDPGARVEREGNVITVDPDDASLCAEDGTGLLGTSTEPSTVDGLSLCRRLVADLTVRLDARTEDSGTISYLFAGAPVLALGYAPGGASGEIFLPGVQRVLERVATIERDAAGGGLFEAMPVPVLRGALRLDARVLDEREESAEIELSVTEALEISDPDGASALTLDPSRVFLLGFDEASGEARLSVAWGALGLIAEGFDASGGSQLTAVALGGLTLDLRATEGSPILSLANVGIGGVPLTIRIGSNDALTLALETFGVTIDGDSGALTFDTDVAIDLALDNLGGLVAERSAAYTARLVANAPRGTRLEDRGDDAIAVTAGGPLTASLLESDESGSTQSEFSVSVGSCLGTGGGGSSDDDVPVLGAPTDFVFADQLTDPLDALDPVAFECP